MAQDAKRIQLLVAHDQPMMREGLIVTLNAVKRFIVVANAADGNGAISLYRDHDPDIVVISSDLQLTEGLSAISIFEAELPSARLVVISSTKEIGAPPISFRFKFYLPANATKDEIVETVSLAAEYVHTPPAVEKLDNLGKLARGPLTNKEISALRLVSMGYTNKSIANVLRISEDAVKSRLKSICRKLPAAGRTHAVTIARKKGYIDL